MTIALTGNQQDLAEAVAGFTARHASTAATRAAFGELAAGQPQPSWQALVRQGFHALHLPESAGGDGAGLVELALVDRTDGAEQLRGQRVQWVVA